MTQQVTKPGAASQVTIPAPPGEALGVPWVIGCQRPLDGFHALNLDLGPE
nr:hypothetical protein [Actinoplanes polyasparticus]